MTDSKCETHPEINRLVSTIVSDFKNGTRPSDNYYDRRMELISVVSTNGLAGVDEQLAQALRDHQDPDEDLARRLTGWALVLVSHTREKQSQ